MTPAHARSLQRSPRTLSHIVRQHVEEAIHLRGIRVVLQAAPQVRLRELQRHDERLVAHLDGIAVAGESGRAICNESLQASEPGAMFVATVNALESADARQIEALVGRARSLGVAQADLIAAFAWASAQDLRDPVRKMLASGEAFSRRVALMGCHAHMVDVGTALSPLLADPDAQLRACALRTAGEFGRRELLNACLDAVVTDESVECRFWAASSAVFLGDRHEAVDALGQLAESTEGEISEASRALQLRMSSPGDAAAVLSGLSKRPRSQRQLIRGAGLAGDPRYVDWLVNQLDDPLTARISGEAITTITGLDMRSDGFECGRPPEFEAEADDIAGDAVGLDDDEGLPWPEPEKVRAWWLANRGRFPQGVRFFMGEMPSRSHCMRILHGGYHRQRAAAAQYLCLLEPGRKLFPVSEPAWRQRRWLDAMGLEG